MNKNKLSLKKILKEEWGLTKKPELTEEDKNIFLEKVRNFNKYGESIYAKGNLREIANELSKISEIASHVILSETDDWFDKVTVNRNMKNLNNIKSEFVKTANEAQSVQERLATLYEDMGLILNRYFTVENLNDSVDKQKLANREVFKSNPKTQGGKNVQDKLRRDTLNGKK